MTLVNPWHFLLRHEQVQVLKYAVKHLNIYNVDWLNILYRNMWSPDNVMYPNYFCELYFVFSDN